MTIDDNGDNICWHSNVHIKKCIDLQNLTILKLMIHDLAVLQFYNPNRLSGHWYVHI